MFKIIIVILLLIVEIAFYYLFGSLASFSVQLSILVFFFYWYYSERKLNFKFTDKLLIISTVVSAFSPLTIYMSSFFIGNIIKFILIGLNYMLTIQIFRIEGAKINFKGKSNISLVFLSYIFMPFAFFVSVLFPLTDARTTLVTGIYMIPLIYMVLLSTFLPFPEKSKLYISLSMFFVLLASGISAYRLYISSFFLDYALLRVCITICRLFMLLGMVHRFDLQKNHLFST